MNWAYFELALLLCGSAAPAAMALLFFTVSPALHLASPLAGDVAGRSHFDLSGAAWPALLLGVRAWLESRALAASLWAGAAALLQPLMGVQALLFMGLAELCSEPRWPDPKALARLLLPGTLCAAPFVLRRLFAPAAQVDPAAVLRFWYPLHYFADAWSLAHVLSAVSALAFGAALLWTAEGAPRRRLRGALAAFALLFAAAALAPGSSLRLLQLFRLDGLLFALALALAARAAWTLAQAESLEDRACAGLLLAAASAKGGPPIWAAAAAAVVLRESPARAGRAAVFAEVFALAAAGELALSGAVLPFAPGPERALALLLLGALVLLELATRRRWLSLPALGLLAALSFLPWAQVAAYRLSHRAWSPQSGPDRERGELGAWARRGTQPSDLFVVPPLADFRVPLGRPVVWEWIDGAAVHWSAAFGERWVSELRRIGVDSTRLEGYWRRRDEEAYLLRPGAGEAHPAEEAYRLLGSDGRAALALERGARFIVEDASAEPCAPGWREVWKGSYYRVCGRG